MTNPFIHALVFIAAVLIPGGLLVYFAWRATRKVPPQKLTTPPTPEEARQAFRDMFPKDSLRARSRRARLDRVKAFRHRNSKK